jgi:predicted outer membrane protein
LPRSLRAVLALLSVLALTLGLAVPASAQAPEPTTEADAAFMAAAAQSNLFEIQSGRLAQRRGQDRDVRMIGRMLVADHTKQLQAGASAATALGLPAPPTTPSAAQQTIVRRLSTLRGRSFDRAFLRAQITAHNQAIALHEGEASATASPTLRTLTVSALPLLGTHLGMVQLVAG